jgi:hypothetical protein
MSKKQPNKQGPIKWSSKEVETRLIDPTPNNYKIKTDLGKELLQTSLHKFGIAGNVIVNPTRNGRYMLIDGNSRLIQARERGEKKLWVSVPNRTLTPKEFQEMSAMYDYAVAGQVDIERIKNDLGTSEDFRRDWNLKVPAAVLDKLGSRSQVVAETNGGGGKKTAEQAEEVPDVMVIQLAYTLKEEKEFRKIEERLAKKFKTVNTAQTVLRALKSIK